MRHLRVGIVAAAAFILMAGLVAPNAQALKPKVTLTVSAASATVGSSVTFTSKVKKAAPRQKVALQRETKGRWKTVATKKLPARGATKKVTFKYKVTTVGTIYFRVKVIKKGKHATVRSKKVAVAGTARPGPTLTPGSTRWNPLPATTRFNLGTWGFKIGSTDPDAWRTSEYQLQFTRAPEPGYSYVMAPITITRVTGEPRPPFINIHVRFIGPDGKVYGDLCGSRTPNNYQYIDDLPAGASETGNTCVAVPTAVVHQGLWRVESDVFGESRFIKPAF